MTKIHKDISGWTAYYRDDAMRWYINPPYETNSYATFTEAGGIVRILRTAVPNGGMARPVGRVDSIREAIVVARANYRITHNER